MNAADIKVGGRYELACDSDGGVSWTTAVVRSHLFGDRFVVHAESGGAFEVHAEHLRPVAPRLTIDVEKVGAHHHVRVRSGVAGQRVLLGTLIANDEDLAALREVFGGAAS